MALFPTHHTLTQGSLHYRLATLGYQKRNTYGVEIFILCHNSYFFALKYMVDCAEKDTTPVVLKHAFHNATNNKPVCHSACFMR